MAPTVLTKMYVPGDVRLTTENSGWVRSMTDDLGIVGPVCTLHTFKNEGGGRGAARDALSQVLLSVQACHPNCTVVLQACGHLRGDQCVVPVEAPIDWDQADSGALQSQITAAIFADHCDVLGGDVWMNTQEMGELMAAAPATQRLAAWYATRLAFTALTAASTPTCVFMAAPISRVLDALFACRS